MLLRVRTEPRRDLFEIVGHALEDLDRRGGGDEPLDHVPQRIREASHLRPTLRGLVFGQAVGQRRSVAHDRTPSTSKSTISGAWSDGDFPLRALRSMSAHCDRSASGFDASIKSMRMPRCLWK